jgi:nucleotide-binding universal stress UspA family protein
MKNSKKDLLVPVDFKIYCLKSIDYAKKLQSISKGKIHLLHVIESQSWWEGFFKSDELVRTASAKLESLKIEQQLPQNTQIKVLLGKRHKEISDYANELNSRYIILADNYPLSKGVKKLGSTLSQVIIKAEKPVISITNAEERIFKNLVVPLDLDQSCRLQLYNSVAIALQHNATIHLVSVLFGEKDLKSSRINQKIEKYKKTYNENGINFTVQLLVKEERFAYKEILKYCDAKDVDSVLIMTHNESVRFDNYLGAFAQHIINEAPMPVVSINNVSAQYWEKKLGDSVDDPLNLFPKK